MTINWNHDEFDVYLLWDLLNICQTQLSLIWSTDRSSLSFFNTTIKSKWFIFKIQQKKWLNEKMNIKSEVSTKQSWITVKTPLYFIFPVSFLHIA